MDFSTFVKVFNSLSKLIVNQVNDCVLRKICESLYKVLKIWFKILKVLKNVNKNLEKLNENYNFYYYLLLLLTEAWVVSHPLQNFWGFGGTSHLSLWLRHWLTQQKHLLLYLKSLCHSRQIGPERRKLKILI